MQDGTILCGIYGEGEIVVNSEHRAGIQRLAMGFRVSGTALDGVIEAIEFATDAWFAMGVQWQPAAGSASGLDIQVFRAVIDAAKNQIDVQLSAAELAKRRAAWKAPLYRVMRGTLYRYIKNVKNASMGCVTDE